mgnify:CR=1 FL=1
MAEVPRIKAQRTAAAMLQLTTNRLRQMETDAAWWRPDLRTAEGYDVCGVVRAQYEWNSSGATDDELRVRKFVAEVETAEFKRQIEELKAWELQRQKELAQGNILPADVHIEFVRELLGMVRSRIEELPIEVADHVPDSMKSLIYVPEELQKSERDASPLQKSIRKLVADVENWLNQDASEETET